MTAKVHVLPAIKTTAELDLKISKQDIVDMIIAERQQETEEIVAYLREQEKQVKEARTAARKAFFDEMVKLARKEFKAMFAVFGEPTKVRAMYNRWVDDDHDRDDDLTDVQFQWQSNEDDDADDYRSCEMHFTITDTRRATSKTLAMLEKVKQTLVEVERDLEAARKEEASLTKRGAQAKAKIVRELLATTAEGQALLQQVKASTRSLLPGTKNE